MKIKIINDRRSWLFGCKITKVEQEQECFYWCGYGSYAGGEAQTIFIIQYGGGQ